MSLISRLLAALGKPKAHEESIWDTPQVRGRVKAQLIRANGEVVDLDNPNTVTYIGRNHILETQFRGGAAISSWFCGLVNASGFTGFNAATDSMSSHTGWAEFTSYDESTRVAWSPGAAASQSVSNASPMVFNINASGTLKGVFIVSASNKTGTTGVLWATALFATDVTVNNGDQLKLTYTVNS